jgi:hypothetical protein
MVADVPLRQRLQTAKGQTSLCEEEEENEDWVDRGR